MAARKKLKLTESIDGYAGCLTETKSYLGKNNFKQLRHERGTLINGGPLTPGNCLYIYKVEAIFKLCYLSTPTVLKIEG